MPIDIRGLAPLIQVFDMPTSVRFYRDILGFSVVASSPALSENPDDVNWAMLRHDQIEFMLNTAYEPESRPPAPEAGRFAGHRDTCLYFGCPDVDAAYRFLRGKGLDIREPKIAPYGMKQLYVNDPDGYLVCFQWTA
jgi:catechol 2,3-dioxygenase-like lactoylglutathione lyase family enzyme